MIARLPETEYAARREKLAEGMQDQGIDALFVPTTAARSSAGRRARSAT